MKGVYKKIAAAFLTVAVCASVPASIAANANSAQTNWSGSYASGAVVTDKNCPVVVESELLIFDIDELPHNYYESEEQFMQYGAKVTAEYTFLNPADYDVEMKLAFPFGRLPDYTPYHSGYEFDDTAKYGITADGKQADRTLRHTFYDWKFNWQTDIARLRDGYKQHEFYYPDMPVYKYDFGIDGIYYKDDYAVHAEAAFKVDNGRRLLTDNSGYESGYGNFKLSYFVKNLDTITIWSIGKPLEELNWRFYYYGRNNVKHTVDGRIYKTTVEETTFKELALSKYSAEGCVSETDWYNAVTDCLDAYSIDGYCRVYDLNVSRYLMRWYEYSLSIPAHGRVVNAVTAPMYPYINGGYSPAVYRYEYLLSPAQSWASFSSLEVRINTPYYMTESPAAMKFINTGYGYKYVSQGLPDGELNFTLCTSAHPSESVWGIKNTGYSFLFFGLPLLIIIGVGGAATGLTFLIIFIVKKCSKQNKAK